MSKVAGDDSVSERSCNSLALQVLEAAHMMRKV